MKGIAKNTTRAKQQQLVNKAGSRSCKARQINLHIALIDPERTASTARQRETKKEHPHQTAFRSCGCPNWDIKKQEKVTKTPKSAKHGNSHMIIPYVAGLSAELRRIFYKHNITVYLKTH